MSINFIERNETWKPYNFSSNFIVNPFWGAIQIIFEPEYFGIFKCEKSIENIWKVHPIYSNFDWVTQKEDILKFSNQKENGDENNVLSRQDSNSYLLLVQKIKKITSEDVTSEDNDVLKELNKYSSNWKDINLKNNVPIICKCLRWELETDEESSVNKVILKRYSGFQLVVDNENSTYNPLFVYNDGKLTSFERSKAPKILSTISGEESLFISDKNSSVYNIPFKDALEMMPISKDEEDICSVFDKNIELIPEEFIFKPVLDYYPYVPYGSNGSANEENGFYYTSVNFTYSEDFPIIKVEEFAPRQECHDLKFEVGNPSFQDGIYFIPVLIKYKKDFSNDLITHSFGDNKKYSLFDNTSFIQIKATCESRDEKQKHKKECYVFLNSDYKLKQDAKITLSIDNDIERQLDFTSGKMIDLPVVNDNGSTIYAFWSNKDNNVVYKNNYKVIDNDQLKGYSWNKVLSVGKKFVKEEFVDDSVSGFPLLNNNNLIYFNKTNSKNYKYDLSGKLTGIWSDSTQYFKDRNYYFISKVLDNNGSYTIKNDNIDKIIAFGYNDDKSNKVSIFDYNFEFKYNLKLINVDKGCFFIPFGNGICSSRDKNIIKILVLQTISNDFIEENNSYYDVLKYKSSIGNICSITINLSNKTAEIKRIKEIQSREESNGNECFCYYPSTSENSFIRNGEKSYVNELICADFDNEIELIEFNNRHKTDIWCFKCKKAKIRHDFNTREVNVVGNNIETVLFLSSDSRNDDAETNEYEGKIFSTLKFESEDKAYFIHRNNIKVLDGSSLTVSDKHLDVNPLKLFYFEYKNVTGENDKGKKACFINKYGIFNLVDGNEIIGYTNNFINVAHVDLSGVYKGNDTNTYDTDCTFIYNDTIWPCFSKNKDYKIEGLNSNGDFISAKIINGLLFVLQKNDKNTLEIFNFGGVYPKY